MFCIRGFYIYIYKTALKSCSLSKKGVRLDFPCIYTHFQIKYGCSITLRAITRVFGVVLGIPPPFDVWPDEVTLFLSPGCRMHAAARAALRAGALDPHVSATMPGLDSCGACRNQSTDHHGTSVGAAATKYIFYDTHRGMVCPGGSMK